jgi:hypothetical protein
MSLFAQRERETLHQSASDLGDGYSGASSASMRTPSCRAEGGALLVYAAVP